MSVSSRGVRDEAARLRAMPVKEGRSAFAWRVDVAVALADVDIQAGALDFNARLATELREQAEADGRPHLWARAAGGRGL